MKSLRLRLLSGTLCWIGLTILVAGLGLNRLFAQHVAAQFQAGIQTHLDQLIAHFDIDSNGNPVLNLPLSDPRFSKPFSGLYWQIDPLASDKPSPQAGSMRSRSLWDQKLALPATGLVPGKVAVLPLAGPGNTVLTARVLEISMDDRPFRLAVAADTAAMDVAIAQFRRLLWASLLLLGGGLVLAAFLQVSMGLSPLRRLQESLARVRLGKSPRLTEDFPREVLPLVEELNRVLEQNDRFLERARTQAGNLAHALKTPLAILTNAVAAPENRGTELGRLVGEQLDVARHQIDAHLARARSAALAKSSRSATPVAPVIQALARTLQRIHADKHLRIEAGNVAPGVSFRGEQEDLQEMLGNLLDNACKWARQLITIDASVREQRLRIRIDDDGEGVSAGQIQAILQRGVRADELTPGSGLGLSIVTELAQLYDGSLTLGESPLGGLRATLDLPATASLPQ